MCELAYELGAGNIILGSITLSGRTYENQNLLIETENKQMIFKRSDIAKIIIDLI